VSSYSEVNAQALGHVGENTPDEIRRAGINTVAYCRANGIGHDEMVELLQAVGIVPGPESPGTTVRAGRYLSPAAQQAQREYNAARKKAARARAKEAS
jgi:hypothetical protein